MNIKAIIRWGGLHAITPRNMRKLLADAFRARGEYWHQAFAPLHFTLIGAGKYNYAPRSPGYNKRKRRQLGHTLPLVFTGETRASAKTAKMTASSNQVRVTLPTRKLNFRPKRRGGQPINLADEMRRIAIDEHEEMNRRQQRDIERRLQHVAKVKQTLIGA